METKVAEIGLLERAVEWLRPFVKNHGWDYCVLWKLNDDPSRFVEFVDCCCAGGYVSGNVNAEKRGDRIEILSVCRDVFQEHPVHTRACEILVQIPATMPLYSGIHTDAAMENQPMWLAEHNATLVLIPLGGGLVELFSAKHVAKDQKTLDFLHYQCNAFVERYKIEIALPGLEPGLRGKMHTCFPGSSSGSNPSLDGSGLLSHVASLPPSMTNSPCSKKPKLCCMRNSSKSQFELAPAQTNASSEHSHPPNPKFPNKEGPKAKNLEFERKRRSRIKDRELQLRALVPNISKMDRASIVGDAIEYIIELKKTVKELEEELHKDDYGENSDQVNMKFSSKGKTKFEVKNSEVKVEVLEICKTHFLLRIEAEQQPSLFSRLMEVISSIGLQVEEVNITTCHGVVHSSFCVEVDRAIQLHELREALIEGLSSPSVQED